MKLKKIDGEQFIILEENEKIYLTTAGKLNESEIEIIENKDKIDILGNSKLVNSIHGEEMLEKVYIPPIVSAEEIIDKCDKWLEMFRKVHDVFRELVLSEKYRKQNIVMELSFTQFFSWKDSDIKGNSINLDLKQNGNIIQEGVTISIDKINEDVYAYLIANVIDYYISKNYEKTQINYSEIGWSPILYSNTDTQKGETKPIVSRLNCLYESTYYPKVITSLLGSHNLDIPADQIISNLRNRISNQKLSDRIGKSIDYSNRQYEYIISEPEDEKQAVLNKTLNQQ